MTATLTFQLLDPDSARVIARSLDYSLTFYTHSAASSRVQAERALVRKDAREAARAERAAVEFDRRVVLTQQLLDQLPADVRPLGYPQEPKR